jgi:hypothetical protein
MAEAHERDRKHDGNRLSRHARGAHLRGEKLKIAGAES